MRRGIGVLRWHYVDDENADESVNGKYVSPLFGFGDLNGTGSSLGAEGSATEEKETKVVTIRH